MENVEVTQPEVQESQQSQPQTEAKYKIKVYGEEQELPLQEILRRAEEASGAQEKFRRAAEMMKEFEEKKEALEAATQLANMIMRLREQPDSVEEFLSALGVNGREYYKNLIFEELRRQALPEHERRLLEIQEENEKLKRELELKRQYEEEARRSEEEAVLVEQSFDEFLDYWRDKTYTNHEVKRTLEVLRFNPDLSIEEAHRIALNDLESYFKTRLGRVKPEEIPGGLQETLRKARVSQARQAQMKPREQEQDAIKPSENVRSFDDFFKDMDRRLKK